LLHFIPVLLEQLMLPNTVLQLLTLISVITYLYGAHRLIERFYRRMKFNEGDRHRYELRWLQKLLKGFALLWLLWIPFTVADYFYYHQQLGMQAYYPFYLCLTAMLIWIAATAYLRQEVGMPANTPLFLKPSPPAELKAKGCLAEERCENQPVLPGPGIKFKLIS
jgi:putative ABC transport system permease protein